MSNRNKILMLGIMLELTMAVSKIISIINYYQKHHGMDWTDIFFALLFLSLTGYLIFTYFYVERIKQKAMWAKLGGKDE